MAYCSNQFPVPLSEDIYDEVCYRQYDASHDAQFDSSQDSAGSWTTSSPAGLLHFQSHSASGTGFPQLGVVSDIGSVTDPLFYEEAINHGSMSTLSWEDQPWHASSQSHTPDDSFPWPPSGLSQTLLELATENQSILTDEWLEDAAFAFTPDFRFGSDSSTLPISGPSIISPMQISAGHGSGAPRTSSTNAEVHLSEDAPSQNSPFLCKECGAIFPQSKPFQQHLKTHEKPNKCTYPSCRWAFQLRKDLRRHMQTHDIVSGPDGQKRHGKFFYCKHAECPYSQKGFRRKDNLQRHCKKQHGENAESNENDKARVKVSRRVKG